MMRQVSSPVRRGTRGKGQKWTSPVCLPSDKRRYNRQAKDADRLGPKGHWSGYRVSDIPCHGQPTLPADREHLCGLTGFVAVWCLIIWRQTFEALSDYVLR